MAKILVTGGCGYIGSHTLVDLVESGYDVISVDNNKRSNPLILDGVEKITGKKVKNYRVDLCNFDDTFAIFQENDDIEGIIHFAAYKSVSESVEKPLIYFENNLVSLINVLKCVQEFEIPWFVFSSSCTVYGNPDEIPVTEAMFDPFFLCLGLSSPERRPSRAYSAVVLFSVDLNNCCYWSRCFRLKKSRACRTFRALHCRLVSASILLSGIGLALGVR